MLDTQTRRNRRQLIMIVMVAVLSIGGSTLLFISVQDSGVWGTTNKGEFVTPPTSVAELNLTSANGLEMTEGGTWWLWVATGERCDEDCVAALYQLRQLHVLLAKDAGRVRRALVTPPGFAVTTYTDEYPNLQHFTDASSAALKKGVYIVDPIGNLVLWYPLTDAGKPVLDDLKRLLKISQIG